MSKEVELFSDESMFRAETQATDGPSVVLLAGPPDPLGLIAQTAKAYQGIFPEGLHTITDEDREYYVKDVGKNMLGSPMETVQFTFQIKGVTRAFTHQLVRQRHGTYQQESMRFAVKEDFPVKTPDSLLGVKTKEQRAEIFARQMGWWIGEDFGTMDDAKWATALHAVSEGRTVKEEQRDIWDETVMMLGDAYNRLVNTGMTAEEARGLAPTDILTNINYTTSLRALMDMSGMRLCTQAQAEWRTVWLQILDAMVRFGERQTYQRPHPAPSYEGETQVMNSNWQYGAIAKMFAPVCYQTGSCKWQSDFDRYCVIRDRVQANAEINRPSSEWGKEYDKVPPETMVVGYNPSNPQIVRSEAGVPLGIPAIRREEWMDHRAAISPDGEWRSEEARNNIAGRRL